MKTLNDIFAAAIKAANSRDNSDVYIVTKDPSTVNKAFIAYLAPYGDSVELFSSSPHIFFYTLGGQKSLFICEADPVGKATEIFDVDDWLLKC